MLAAAAAIAAVTLAVFPSSSQTSTGLGKFSAQGAPVSFSGTRPPQFGTPYVLAQFDGKAYFHVQQTAPTTIDKAFANDPHLQHASFPRECYGDGTLADGELTVLSLDCTPFPTPERPVLLPHIAMDVSNGATLLFLDGFAADGVARLELLGPDQQVVAQAPVENNVFHFEGISGRAANGALVAFDRDDHEVWRQSL
jgi:hypothetical protein